MVVFFDMGFGVCFKVIVVWEVSVVIRNMNEGLGSCLVCLFVGFLIVLELFDVMFVFFGEFIGFDLFICCLSCFFFFWICDF